MPKVHCEGSLSGTANHCDDHSGQLMWMRGIASMMALSAGLLTYSVFWQAPSIQTEIAKEVARVDSEIKLVKKDVELIRCDITDLKGRVGVLERKK